MIYQLCLIGSFAVISGLIELPFDYYRQFVLEEYFGFNKMTRALFFGDAVKTGLIGAAIGLPLLWVILTLMDQAGALWWCCCACSCCSACLAATMTRRCCVPASWATACGG